MNVGHIGPELTLVVGAVVVLLAAAFLPRPAQWAATPLALGTVATAAAWSLWLGVTVPPQLTMMRAWALDGVTTGAELTILTITALTLAMAHEWIATDPRRGEYPAIMLFSATGAMLLAGAADTMELIVGMLLVSVTGYTLAAYHRQSPAAVEAGMKYFLIGALTNAVLLVGVIVLFGLTGTTTMADIAAILAAAPAQPVAIIAVIAAVGVGLAFEIGAVPAHAWVPDVAQGAPAPSSAFLTVVPKIGATIALARVLALLPLDGADWRVFAALLAAATMTLGNLAALWQDDLRRLLGWSSVSQAGYALMAVVVLGRSDVAVPALVYFLAGYAIANTAAFGVVVELRGRTRIDDYRGLAAARPVLAATLVVSLLSLVGIPPLAGFVGKLALFTAAIEAGYGWLAALAVANTVASLFYYLRVLGPMYFDAGAAAEPAVVPVLGRWAGLAAVVGGVATLGIGLAAEPLLAALANTPLLP
ncbi:MAG: NADH-quinone oxidoreductase subunit N [Actinobacteria bacterium]|nr:NADH-quinone oxidoreductase subunit N [Actinomycetota bacterium]